MRLPTAAYCVSSDSILERLLLTMFTPAPRRSEMSIRRANSCPVCNAGELSAQGSLGVFATEQADDN